MHPWQKHYERDTKTALYTVVSIVDGHTVDIYDNGAKAYTMAEELNLNAGRQAYTVSTEYIKKPRYHQCEN